MEASEELEALQFPVEAALEIEEPVAAEDGEKKEPTEAEKAAAEKRAAFPYYKANKDDWTTAQVDLSDYGHGIYTITEPVTDMLRKADNIIGQKAELEGDQKSRAAVANLRSFLSKHEYDPGEPSGCRVKHPLPRQNADLKVWVTWYASLPQKVAARLHISLQLFNQDYGVDFGKN